MQQRWQEALAGSYSGPAGEWDRFVMLALRFGWSEQQIWQSSPDFLDELVARLNAEGAHKSPAAGRKVRQTAEQKRAKTMAWSRSRNAAAIRQMSGKRH